ncbi:MAG: helix-turn-helix domain-containing protein [Candidatus Doudnabacteria bacterium]
MERKTISIPKACELVGVSRRTIYNWIETNKVEYMRIGDGTIRIFIDSLWREAGDKIKPGPEQNFIPPPKDIPPK